MGSTWRESCGQQVRFLHEALITEGTEPSLFLLSPSRSPTLTQSCSKEFKGREGHGRDERAPGTRGRSDTHAWPARASEQTEIEQGNGWEFGRQMRRLHLVQSTALAVEQMGIELCCLWSRGQRSLSCMAALPEQPSRRGCFCVIERSLSLACGSPWRFIQQAEVDTAQVSGHLIMSELETSLSFVGRS